MSNWIYAENNSPNDRFTQIEFLRDDSSIGFMRKGLSYTITDGEVARVRRFVVLVAGGAGGAPVRGDGSVVTSGAGGSGQWKDSVATVDDLPLSNNGIGDVRLVRSELVLYTWDGAQWISATSAGGMQVRVWDGSVYVDGQATTFVGPEAPPIGGDGGAVEGQDVWVETS